MHITVSPALFFWHGSVYSDLRALHCFWHLIQFLAGTVGSINIYWIEEKNHWDRIDGKISKLGKGCYPVFLHKFSFSICCWRKNESTKITFEEIYTAVEMKFSRQETRLWEFLFSRNKWMILDKLNTTRYRFIEAYWVCSDHRIIQSCLVGCLFL